MRRRLLVARFRLRPEWGRPDYYTVLVFPSMDEFRRFVGAQNKRMGFGGRIGRAAGLCRPWIRLERRGGRWCRHPELGQVLLVRQWLGAGYVAHELAHAAVGWARRWRLSGAAIVGRERRGHHDENAVSERFCRVIEQLNAQFWDKWFRRVNRKGAHHA